jgi:hypothetical protein
VRRPGKGAAPALALDARAGDGLVLWPNLEFTDGVIDFDVRGKDESMSFVGIAFHGRGPTVFEAVYFRPFNFRHADPASRSHAVQYISNPEHTWDRLREATPGKYESAVVPPPDPGGWLHARVVVAFPKVSVFVNGAAEPSLVVDALGGRRAGWIGLWVGNSSSGEFANLRVSSVSDKRTFFDVDSDPTPDREPELTRRLRSLIQDSMDGQMRAGDYSPELWGRLAPVQKDIAAELQRQGRLLSLALLDRQTEGALRVYRYRLEFENARAVERFVFDQQDRLAEVDSEGGEARRESGSRP